MSLDRLLLTLATVAFFGGVMLLMLRGWRSRQRRQADVPPPPPPSVDAGEPLVAAVTGLFVGTTFADDWLDRVAVHGLAHRANATLGILTAGVRIDRDGAAALWLPWDVVTRAEVGDALAGKVMGKGGMLLLDWRLGDRLLTSGFRADDHRQHVRLAEAIDREIRAQEDAR
jgi:hypothetical protein